MTAGSFSDLVGQLDFWRGVGRLVLILLLIVSMFVLVMAYSGNPIRLPSRRRKGNASGADHAQRGYRETTGGTTGVEADEPAPQSGAGRIRHLDLLATLRTSLRYQGSTVALVVFSVLILGVDRVLSGSEVATILAGITGYVLGSQRSTNESPDAAAAAHASQNDSGGAGQK